MNLTDAKQAFLENYVSKLQKHDWEGLSEAEVSLGRAFMSTKEQIDNKAKESKQLREQIQGLTAKLQNMEDEIKNLIGKSTGILESVLMLANLAQVSTED